MQNPSRRTATGPGNRQDKTGCSAWLKQKAGFTRTNLNSLIPIRAKRQQVSRRRAQVELPTGHRECKGRDLGRIPDRLIEGNCRISYFLGDLVKRGERRTSIDPMGDPSQLIVEVVKVPKAMTEHSSRPCKAIERNC